MAFGIFEATAQPWLSNLPQAKSQYNFYDYQTAFNTYWAPYNVQGGTYVVNGVTKKAIGYKQFKRWQWEMESQIDPSTGDFPSVSAMEVYNTAKQSNQIQSLTGNTNTWTSLGPSSSTGGYAGIGRVNCIAFHPTDNNTYWIGAPAGGLWKTSDNGSSWICLTDSNDVLGVSSIIIPSDYSTSNTIYIGTGDRDAADNRSIGVLKSTDGGLTWNTTGLSYTLGQNKLVYKMILDPTNNNTIIAATSGGVYKTTNGGTTWSTQLSTQSFIDLEYKPSTFSTLYGSTKWGEIYVSTNSGTSWTPQSFNNGSRIELAVSPANSSVVYALIGNSSGGFYGIYKSINSGSSFSLTYNSTNLMNWNSDGSGSNDGQSWYDISLAVSPTDINKVIMGGVNSHKSTNGGTSWSCSNCWTSYSGYNFGNHPEVHADKHNLVYRSNGDLFECNDGGIYLSSNNGLTWSDKSNGLKNSQMYKLGVSQTVSTETITGLQDNGTKLFSNGTWSDVKGGDGMECIIDYTDVNIQYGTYVNGQISLTTNHWLSSTAIEPSSAGNGAWVTPYILDPVNHQTIYAGYSNVWKSTNKGTTWSQISTMSSGQKLRSIAIAPSNNLTLYVADLSSIWKTVNGGTSWTSITGTLPVASSNIMYITVKDNDPNTVWVTLGGYNSNGVFKTTNGGTTWTNMSTGLPSIPINSIVQDKTNTTEEILYAGTQLGVYIKTGLANWVEYNLAFPKVRIGELEIYYNTNPSNNKLRAATYGRGLWEVDLYTGSTSQVPICNFGADKTSICTGDSTNLIDSTYNNPTSWAWTISPSNVTYVGSTSNSSQNPIVKFNNSGIYSVSLTATNADGSDTKTINSYITVGGAQAPFIEDFESSSTTLGDWLVSNPDAGSITWGIYNTSGNGSSARSIFINNYAYNGAGDIDNLVMPIINLENETSAYLQFKHAYTRYTGYPSDTLVIFISSNCGATYSVLDSLYEDGTGSFATAPDNTSNFIPATASDWCGSSNGADCDSIDISAYAGNSNIRIIFQNITAFSNNLFIDDVQVIGTNTSNVVANFDLPTSNICTGTSTTFTNTSQNATTYQWKIDNISISTSQNLSYTFTSGGTKDIKLIVSDGTDFDSISKIVTVGELPTQAATPTGPINACTSTPSTYTTTGATGANTYTWDLSPSTAGSITGNGLTSNVIWNTSFVGTASIKVKGNSPCGNGSFSTILSVNISTSPAIATTPSGPVDLCINPTNSTYTVSAIANAATYNWTLTPTAAGTITNTGINATIDWANTYTGNIALTVAGVNSCGNGTISPALNIVINNTPLSPSTPSGPSSRCNNSSNTNYSVNTIPGASIYTWEITPSNAATLTGTGSSVNIDWNNSYVGSASLKTKAENNCGVGPFSNNLTISINGTPPTPTVTLDAGIFTSSSSTNNQWFRSNNIISGATNQTYMPYINGSYSVEVSNSNNCKSMSTSISINNVGINTTLIGKGLNVYPNPANDYIIVEYAGEEKIVLNLRNAIGEDILSTEFIKTTKLDLSKISSGVYFIEMHLKENPNATVTKKIIITKD